MERSERPLPGSIRYHGGVVVEYVSVRTLEVGLRKLYATRLRGRFLGPRSDRRGFGYTIWPVQWQGL
jgi:hypothetical protein